MVEDEIEIMRAKEKPDRRELERIARDLDAWAVVQKDALALYDRAGRARAELWRRHKEAGGKIPEDADTEHIPWPRALERWRAEGGRRGFRKGQELMRARAGAACREMAQDYRSDQYTGRYPTVSASACEVLESAIHALPIEDL